MLSLHESCPNIFLVSYVEEITCTKPPKREQKESKKLCGERDEIKFIGLIFERWQVVRFRKARRRQLKPY